MSATVQVAVTVHVTVDTVTGRVLPALTVVSDARSVHVRNADDAKREAFDYVASIIGGEMRRIGVVR